MLFVFFVFFLLVNCFFFEKINGVIPPDEYAVNVSNSAYTNSVASLSFKFATRFGKELNKTVDPQWDIIAENLIIPIDTKEDIVLEYEGYNGQIIKQADVVLMDYPLMVSQGNYSENNLNYYGPKTDSNGPAMTW